MTKPEISLALIDGPSPYEPLETWERHLSFLLTLPDNNPLKSLMIEAAEKRIAGKKSAER